jgi:hypothetical protein
MTKNTADQNILRMNKEGSGRLCVPLKLPIEAIAFSTLLTHPMHRHCMSTWRLNRLFSAPSCEDPKLSGQV